MGSIRMAHAAGFVAVVFAALAAAVSAPPPAKGPGVEPRGAFVPSQQPPRDTKTPEASRAAVVMLPAGTPTWEGLGELAASINAGSYGAYQDVGVVTVVGGTLVGVGLLEGRIFSEGDTIPNGPVWNPTNAPVFIKTKHPHDPDHWIFEYTVAPNGLIHVGYLARSEPKKTRRDEDKDGSVSLRDGEAPPGCPNTVSVTCVAGYYVCCYFQVETICPRAVCVKNGQPPPTSCIAGGEGTASCSLTIP